MKSCLLIGVNHLGTLIAKRMMEIGYEVMAVDNDETRINTIQSYVTDSLIGDSTNEEFLKSLGVREYDLCFVTIASDFQYALMTIFLLKELGAVRVIGRANGEIQEKLLIRSGADEVINPEKLAAEWAAARFGDDSGE
jgi:trk system potassium uptake protein TrkA